MICGHLFPEYAKVICLECAAEEKARSSKQGGYCGGASDEARRCEAQTLSNVLALLRSERAFKGSELGPYGRFAADWLEENLDSRQ